MTDHWTVCQVFSKRAPRILAEAQDMQCGGFLPTYSRIRYADGKRSSSERQLMPGYLFVRLRPEDRGRIAELDGVYRILPGGTRSLSQLEAQMTPLVVAHATGAWDEIEGAPVADRVERRPRKPRPSKRVRRRLRAARVHTPTP